MTETEDRSLIERAALLQRLKRGAGAEPDSEFSNMLGLDSTTSDNEVARALVRSLANFALRDIDLLESGGSAGESGRETSRVFDNRASYLMRLATDTEERGTDLRRIDDLRTLVAVVHAGTLRQRRAATLRLGELLREPRSLPGDQVRSVTDTLIHLRKFEIAYELSTACAGLTGAEGRRARAGRREWGQLVERVAQEVRDYWDGERAVEPVSLLHGDQLVQLLVRTRDLPDDVMRHLCALIEGTAGTCALADRVTLVAALLNAADSRLVPSLRSALDVGEVELVAPTVRALGRMDDPRVHPILRSAYERMVKAEQRLAVAGALGMVGDHRGHGYVREVLAGEDVSLLPLALHALDSLGTSEDVLAVTSMLERPEAEVLTAAVRTLSRIGDSRAILPLSKLWQGAERSALRAEVEEARAAILSRMELLGEELPEEDVAAEMFATTKHAALSRHRDPAVRRLRAKWSVTVGYLFRALGAHHKAVASFEAAAALRPAWATPVLAVALAYSRHGKYAQALATFRRALEIDREQVEKHPTAVRHMAQSFLRRAEAVEMDGRHDIAFGLLEEALSLDLRKAPSGLRFALSQLHEVLRVRMV